MARHQLSEGQIGLALGMKYAGATQRQIAIELSVQQPSISRLFHKSTTTPFQNRGPRRCYKCVTDLCTDRLIVRTVIKARHMSLKALATKVNFNVSYKTIQYRLKSVDIKKGIARTKPFLLPKSMVNRLKWALEHQYWTVEQ